MANYKVCFIPNLDSGDCKEFEVNCYTREEAFAVSNAIADYTLFLHDNGLMPDHSNQVVVLVEDIDGEWIEVDDDE